MANADLEAERYHEIDAMAHDAYEAMRPDLDAAFRRVVSDQVGHEDWPGDVDPHAVLNMDRALHGVLWQLIDNGTPEVSE